MHTTFLLLVTLPLLFFLNTIFALIRNYLRVRHLRLPKIYDPVRPNAIWVQLLTPLCVPLLRKWPRRWHRWVYLLYAGSTFDDRYFVHELLGKEREGGNGKEPAGLYVLVTAGYNDVYVADASAAEQITSRSREFQKPTEMYKPLEVFGPNVDTVEGDTWKLHRKATTGSFNERNFSSVWNEALRQAKDMLQIWLSDGPEGTKTTDRDTKVVALHVMTGTLFSRRSSFKSGIETPQHGQGTMDFQNAMATILDNLMIVFAVPTNIMNLSFMPKKFGLVEKAFRAFKAQVATILEEEEAVVSKREPGTGNLITSLIRSSQESKGHSRGLDEKEVLGNVFIYSFAGHETTAAALTYSLLMLAAHPEYQSWLREEIDAVIGDGDNIEEWEYQALYPRLKRCLAVMLESLRLYGPVTAIPKYTNTSSLDITTGDETHMIPPKTVVSINLAALHTLPRYWGSDSLKWRPTRWIQNSHSPDIDRETLYEPVPGSFMPWSSGPRVCPGRKFSQVEFVAVIVALFRKCKVKPAFTGGETVEMAREKIVRVVNDSRVTVTLQVQDPASVPLVWTRT